MKMKDVRSLTEAEIRTKVQEFRQELLNLQIQQQTGRLERSSRVREIRVSIARLLTHLNSLTRKENKTKAA